MAQSDECQYLVWREGCDERHDLPAVTRAPRQVNFDQFMGGHEHRMDFTVKYASDLQSADALGEPAGGRRAVI